MKVAKRADLKCFHHRKGEGIKCEVMEVLIDSIMVIVSKYTRVSNHHGVHVGCQLYFNKAGQNRSGFTTGRKPRFALGTDLPMMSRKLVQWNINLRLGGGWKCRASGSTQACGIRICR